ncbi:SDR family oxidoreductase [uncultured Martelella sp.]|uniref:SDR family oxidoreductase n=1 Tax=uncultured Martelella sp. TaxID=392331 RepID=UPI0029C6B486|nr:SDR family oxidoreductase [uncultured Martelella sp.]
MSEQKTVLVTGANKGIGLEIARKLAAAGMQVIIGARDDGRAQKAVDDLGAEGLVVRPVHIDIDDSETIAAAAAWIEEKHGRLDVLVNNAGIFDFSDGPPDTAAISAVRRVMETNFIGTLAVTQAMLPLLRKAENGRIINISSSLGSLTLNGDPTSPYYASQFIGYNASKAALNMLTVQLHEALRGSRIVVNSVSPGFVKTDLTGFGAMTPEEGARLPARFALEGAESGGFFEPDGKTPW